MKNMNLLEDDPQLVKLIHLLRQVPERNPVKAERNREKFLAELDELFPERKAGPFSWLKNLKHQTQIRLGQGLRPRAALIPLIMVLLIAFLFGGTSLTVSAAQNALPGDALYPIKTRLEQTRLRLISADDQLATAQLELAQKRLDEIEALIRENRFDQVSSTAAQFEDHIRKALEALQRLAQTNPERAGQLSVQMTDALERYLQALSRLLEKLPPEVKSAVEETISKSSGLSPKPTAIQRGDDNENENERKKATQPALSNENRNENDAETGNRNENEKMDNENEAKALSDFTFVGFVEKIATREWLISGIRIRVASTTKIDAGIKTGDKVEVKVEWLDSQSVQAKEIRLRESGRKDSNENKNENDQQNENDENENSQENNNESKETQNENSKSVKSDDTNQNLNDNDNDSDDKSNDNNDND